MAVEATRLNIDISKKMEHEREELARTVKSINAMRRTLRKGGMGDSSVVEDADGNNILRLLPEDQRVLRADIAEAQNLRVVRFGNCRKLRRRVAVFRCRADRLRRTLSLMSSRALGISQALGHIMGHLRSQLSLLRVQERVFHRKLKEVEKSGLRSRKRLAANEEYLMLLERHRLQVSRVQLSHVLRNERSAKDIDWRFLLLGWHRFANS